MKFTNQLPPGYENDGSGYVLNLYPDPSAVSFEPRMTPEGYKFAHGPDPAGREGIVTTTRGRNLGRFDRLNREEGKQYTWCKLADYFAQPAPDAMPASNVEEIETLREQIKQGIERELYYREQLVDLRDHCDLTLGNRITPAV
jgi:hypothetical protein